MAENLEKKLEDTKIISYKSFQKEREKYFAKKQNISELTPFLYLKYNKNVKTNQGRDLRTSAIVNKVPSSSLPKGILGYCDPNTNSIYVASDRNPKEVDFIYNHEATHALGLIDESITDLSASLISKHILYRKSAYSELAS